MKNKWLWTGGMVPQPIGLDFSTLPSFYEGYEVSPEKRPEVFQGLLAMEDAALAVMNKT